MAQDNKDFNVLTSGQCCLAGEIGYSSRLKQYPDGYCLTAASRNIFRLPGWEADQPEKHSGGYRADIPPEVRAQNNLQRSQRRAATALRDLALSNDWQYFVTFTLSADKVNRYDVPSMTRKLNQWLDNRVRRKGLKYIIVPELHKDGALHYHGLINDCLPAVDSGTISRPGDSKPRKPRSKRQREEWLADGGHVVYNLPDWGYGFSTAIQLYGDKLAAVRYVCKYITKAPKKIAGRWYYHSNNLQQPRVIWGNLDIDGLEAYIADELRNRGLSDDDIAARIGRMYSQIEPINVTLLTYMDIWEDDANDKTGP